ncbi:MAG: 1-acyl-sn-glycerol-3-phosphate acyltransferase [Pseudomonadota bacterium]
MPANPTLETETATPGTADGQPIKHVVDTLIEERATQLRKHPFIWKMVQQYMYPVFGYQTAINLVDRVQGMSGYEVFAHLSNLLQMRVTVEGLEHLPTDGRAVIMPNHPAGIADGIAVFDAIKEIRPDMAFFANRDAVRCQPRLDEIIIPVEWMEQRRNHAKSKETVRTMLRAFKDERLIVIFASGRLAQPTLTGLKEREWLASGVSLAQRYHCPIIPMHITGHNSLLYYLLWFLNTELKDMTLFRELLNKTNQRYHIRIGAPITSAMDPEQLTPQIRQFVVNDLKHGRIDFTP